MNSLLSSYSVKVTALFLLVGLIPIIGISIFLYTEEVGAVYDSLEVTLETQSETTSKIINQWYDERELDVIDFATNNVVISKVNTLQNSNSPKEKFNARFDLESQASIFLKNNPWISEFVISDKYGELLFISGNRLPTEKLSEQNHFLEALNGNIGTSEVFLSTDFIKNEANEYEQSIPTMWISYPIKGEVGIKGVICVRVNIFEMPLNNLSNSNYETIDTFLVDSNGFLLSKPKFFNLENQIRPELNYNLQSIPSHIFNSKLDDKSFFNIDGYDTYYDETVIGVITPIMKKNWFVITEINKQESDSLIIPTQILIFDFTSLSALTILGASLFLASNIINPIRKLKRATEVVSSGNFDIKLKPKGSDEIAYLFESFNSMTESLKNATGRLLSTELKYQELYDNAPDLYRTINTDGVIIDCNSEYAKSLGYSKKEIKGKSIFEHVDDENRIKLNEIFAEWKKNKTIKDKELFLKRKDGSIFPTMINVSSIYDENGNLIGSNTAIRDMTEINRVKIEIENSKKIIEKQLEDLKKVDRAKDEFLAMVTHELRTPLVPIQAYVEILLSEKLGPVNKTQKEKLKILESSSKSMLKLIKDLLDAQKLELGELKLEQEIHELSNIIENAITRLKPNAEKFGVSINSELEKPVMCFCDKTRIEQVMTNLLSNSLDFCPKQTGKIFITLFSENNHAKIIVRDNGIGIVKENIDKIFVKFYQADTSNTREHGGTGLGLSVCKGLIEKHGGKIWAESEGSNKGAEIHISLPLESKNFSLS